MEERADRRQLASLPEERRPVRVDLQKSDGARQRLDYYSQRQAREQGSRDQRGGTGVHTVYYTSYVRVRIIGYSGLLLHRAHWH